MAYIGRQPTVGNFRICDAISVVDGQAAYTMQVGAVNVVPESHNNMIVSLNGVIQKPGSSFTVSSSTITFSSNLSTGDVIDFIQILGGVANIGTPSDGTVTPEKLNLSSGNVGIGTNSPAHNLEIVATASGSVNDSLQIRNNSTTTGSGSRLRFITSTDKNSDTNGAAITSTRTGDDNVLAFETENVERMKIDTLGRVTKPYQPAFSATAGQNNIPLSTQTTITLGTERFDVGSNLSSDTFTAPVTGKYLFTYMLYFTQLDADHTTLDVHFKTSNKQYQQTWSPDHFLNSDSNFSVSSTIIADMDANDTMYFAVYCVGGSAQTDIHSDSQVSGCLLL